MSSGNNIPREIQDSIRDVLDRKIKISIKRMVKQEVRADKVENRVLALSPCRLFVLAAKVPSKVEHSFHFLDIQALESKKVNQLSVTVDGKVYSFTTQDSSAEDFNHIITHIGLSFKQIFPAFPLERLIMKVDVVPQDRLRVMNDMIRELESKDVTCGGFSTQYACMCDYHSLPFRDEVAWDVDTIYLSQDCHELNLRDFDHLSSRDAVPIISALEHNTWFTSLDCTGIRLSPEICNEILQIMKRNAIMEKLKLSNTGIKSDFVVKLSTALLSNSGSQLSYLDLSSNLLDDRGVTHLMGTLKTLSRGLYHLDLSRTGIGTRCVAKTAETIAQSETLLRSLQTLKVADNLQKGEEIGGLYQCLAQPNVLQCLDLSGTDCAMDMLVGPLLMGCTHLATLSLSRTAFTHKRSKDMIIPVTWKQFFASTCSLVKLDLSATRIPAEVVKELLLGIASNRHIKDLELDLSSNELGSTGAQVIAECISNIACLGRLDISNNGFDADLKVLLPEVAKNKHLKHLALGRNFNNIKPKHMWSVLDTVVQLLQEEETMLESLSLADSKLKQDTACIINALGSNVSLMYLDISGNMMGDFGARLLSKALQINTKLHTVVWDRNSITAQGFEDIANALEKNFTLKEMPTPVNDAAAAMRTQAQLTEAALQKVEQLLQRNHSPRRFASDQQYRLQQGFLISSTQQMVDRLCIQVQDSVNALKMGHSGSPDGDLQRAEKIIKDADNSKHLLPKLQDIAIRSQDSGSSVEITLQTMADKLRSAMEETMQKSVEDMLKCTAIHCEGVMTDKAFCGEVESGCRSKSALPKDFAKLILDSISTDVFNKISELNLAVAAYISDNIIDEIINKLSDSHKGLTHQLNLKISGHNRSLAASREQLEKMDTENEKADRGGHSVDTKPKEPSGDNKSKRSGLQTLVMGLRGSPKLSSKRKTVVSRKLRPQSVIDHDHVPKSPVERDSVDAAGGVAAPRSLKQAEPASPIRKPKSIAEIEEAVTDELDEVVVVVGKSSSGSDSLDQLKESTDKGPRLKGSVESLDLLPDLPDTQTQKLEHLNKARPKRPKTRAATRPVVPGLSVGEEATDEGVRDFYTKPSAELEPARPPPSPLVKQPSEDAQSKAKKAPWLPKMKEKKDEKKDEQKKGFTISNLFRKANKSDAKDKEKEREKTAKHESAAKHDSLIPHQTETSKVYSRNSRADSESPKVQRPPTTLTMSPPPMSPPSPTPELAKQPESPKMAPTAAAESLDLDEEHKPHIKVRSPSGEVKAKLPDSGQDDEKSRSSKSDSRSSSAEEEETSEPQQVQHKEEAKGTEERAAHGHVEESKPKVEEPAPAPGARVIKGLPKVGFGAGVMADLLAQKRFSRVCSSEEQEAGAGKKPEQATGTKKAEHAAETKKPEHAAETKKPEHAAETKKPEHAAETRKPEHAAETRKPEHAAETKKPEHAAETRKEETNNNEVTKKEDAVKKEKLAEGPAMARPPEKPPTLPAKLPDKLLTVKLPEKMADHAAAAGDAATTKPAPKAEAAKLSQAPQPRTNDVDSATSPKPAPRALLPPKKPVAETPAPAPSPTTARADSNGEDVTERKSFSESSSSSSGVPLKPRPTPPSKPKPPVTAPKPRNSLNKDSPPREEGGSGEVEEEERHPAEGQIVYDSATLRLSVKDKIKRLSLSQVKFEPPGAVPAASQKKSTSLSRDAKLPETVPESDENSALGEGAVPPKIIKHGEENGDAAEVKDKEKRHKGPKSPTGDDEIMV